MPKYAVDIIEGTVWRVEIEADSPHKAEMLAHKKYDEHWEDGNEYLMEELQQQDHHTVSCEEIDVEYCDCGHEKKDLTPEDQGCKDCCDGNYCTYGCGLCYCGCHDYDIDEKDKETEKEVLERGSFN